jgi:mono/diheme cytochrome c family protein
MTADINKASDRKDPNSPQALVWNVLVRIGHWLLVLLFFVSCLLVFMFIGSPATLAQTIDPHELYEQRCSGCHAPHAGEYVHDNLKRLGDKIVGRDTGMELRSFLTGGHGKLAPGEIDVMFAHLASILEGGALFRERCLICHGRAVALARSQIILRDGRLVGRYTGRDIGTFLENHGRLKGVQIATVIQMLERQLATQTAD